jgi:hypothetical protein
MTYYINYKSQRFLVRVHSDILCRGGLKGKGTMTYINALDSSGKVIPIVRGFQGAHTRKATMNTIRSLVNIPDVANSLSIQRKQVS